MSLSAILFTKKSEGLCFSLIKKNIKPQHIYVQSSVTKNKTPIVLRSAID